ncbi:hypothetical protein [Vulcanisaeta distributa]|uniref:hypothetical protein n=1 Tax=Vulcanisaeta distributa TaxID=164451 RepID=UPI001FB4B039|nr:hypothetical protein [Vulcanisaeta distributa]
MVRALITDPVDEYIVNELSRHGVIVDYKPGISKDDLLRVVGDYEILVVRSRTKVTREVIDAAGKLKVIARAGVGLDNIDVNYARSRGHRGN